MVMGFGSCLFECGNPNNSESAHDLDFPGAAVDDLGKRHYAALRSSRPTGSFRATPPPASYTTSRDAPKTPDRDRQARAPFQGKLGSFRKKYPVL